MAYWNDPKHRRGYRVRKTSENSHLHYVRLLNDNGLPPFSPFEKWKLRAAEQQQTFHTLFSSRQYDLIELPARNSLWRKLAFTFYACTPSKCTVEQVTCIRRVLRTIFTWCREYDKKEFEMGYIYVSTWDTMDDGIIPLIHVKIGNKRRYIDLNNNTYTGWRGFLTYNAIEAKYICFPKGGFYNSSKDLVDVVYRTSEEDKGLVHDCAVSTVHKSTLFFPLYVPPTSVFTCTILKDKYQSGTQNYYTDLHALSKWLDIIRQLVIEGRLQISRYVDWRITVKKLHVEAMKFFRLFYTSPYGVSGYFVSVHLMMMLTYQKIDHCDMLFRELLPEFVNMLIFMANIQLTNYDAEQLVEQLHENCDSYLSHIFQFRSLNHPWNNTKFNVLHGAPGIKQALESITKSSDTQYSSMPLLKEKLLKLVDVISTISQNRTIDVNVLGPLVSRDVFVRAENEIFKKLYKDTVKRRMNIKDIIFGTRNHAEYSLLIDDYPEEVLRLIFFFLNKIDAAFTSPEVKQICKIRFLKFAIDFATSAQNPVDTNHRFCFIFNKLISVFQSYYVESKSRIAPAEWHATNIIDQFIAWVRGEEIMLLLKEAFEEFDKPFKKNYRTMALLDFRQIHVDGIIKPLPWSYRREGGQNKVVDESLISIFDRSSGKKLICDYFNDFQFPAGNMYEDDVVMIASEGTQFAIGYPFKPNQSVHLTDIDTVGIYGLVLTFDLTA